MSIGISNLSELLILISYDKVVSITVASIVLSLSWFILRVRNNINKSKEHDEKLFKQPPPPLEDCPICFHRLPILNTGKRYQSCCGKFICSGCTYAPVYDDKGNEVTKKVCPFCRTPWPCTDKENTKRLIKRVEVDDAIAIFNVGGYHLDGRYGFPRDYKKALELFHRAGSLGNTRGYHSIGYAYGTGRGVEVVMKKATHYYELAAMGGNEVARHNLGNMEIESGNFDRALRHYTIAVRGGYADSLKNIKDLYLKRHATKEYYTKALQLYQEYLGEIKSKQRDEAAAFDERYRYY